jgi:hypothetical protein
MLVLGYASATDKAKPSITVPPFHTGHLGFVPGTPVRISLVAAPATAQHCEVIVTPFEQDARYLALVSVTMRDEPGVVARLITAVAALGINIEVQESSSINLLDHHFVSLLVDLSESSISTSAEFSSPAAIPASPTAVRRLYRNYDSVFPVRDFRFVRLFESIVAYCADVIVWKEISGEYFPDIDIHPYSDRPLAKSEFKALARGNRQLHVEVDLPDGITNRLKRDLGTNDQLEYMLVSDTTTRTLHAFFFHPKITARLFHIGFFHNDVPGALATILTLMRDAKFNILTSLMRKQKDSRNVWEAVLEYQGDSEVPPSDSRPAHSPISQAELNWTCNEIVAAHTRLGSTAIDCDIVIAPPMYPLRSKDAEAVEPVALSEHLTTSHDWPSAGDSTDRKVLVRDRRKSLEERQLDPEVARKSEALLKLIEAPSAEGTRPVVFLSYPKSAMHHGEAVYKLLEDQYRIEQYQEPDGEVIVETVISKIEASDYFIGIWHHEQEPDTGKQTPSISPWMLFEYGVARAAEKPAIVVHSAKLDEHVWRRIDPEVSTPAYTDFDFNEKTLETIREYCQRHFR